MSLHSLPAAVDDSDLTGTLTWPSAPASLTGTLTFYGGSNTVDGSGTSFLTEVAAGDLITLSGKAWRDPIKNFYFEVSFVESDTRLYLRTRYLYNVGAAWDAAFTPGTALIAKKATARTVTGSGTSFASAVHPVGDVGPSDIAGQTAWIIDVNGLPCEVESVESDTSLTLKKPYVGSAGAGTAGKIADAAAKNSQAMIWKFLGMANGDTIDGDVDEYAVGNLPRYKALSSNITIAAGSKAVSAASANTFIDGSGNPIVSKGDQIKLDADGVWARVASVTDDQNLVLVDNYAGVGGTGVGTVDYDFQVQGVSVSKSWSDEIGYLRLRPDAAKNTRAFEFNKELTVDCAALSGGNPQTNFTTHPSWGITLETSGIRVMDQHWVVHRGEYDVIKPVFNRVGFENCFSTFQGFAPHEMNSCRFFGAGQRPVTCLVDERIAAVNQIGGSQSGLVRTKYSECQFETDQQQVGIRFYGGYAADVYKCKFSYGETAWWSIAIFPGRAGDQLDNAGFLETRDAKDIIIDECEFVYTDSNDRAIAVDISAETYANLIEDIQIKGCTIDGTDCWGGMMIWVGPSQLDSDNYVIDGVYIAQNTIQNMQSWVACMQLDKYQNVGLSIRELRVTANTFDNQAATTGNGVMMRRVSKSEIVANDWSSSNYPQFAGNNFWNIPMLLIRCDFCGISENPNNFPSQSSPKLWSYLFNCYKCKVNGAAAANKPPPSERVPGKMLGLNKATETAEV